MAKIAYKIVTNGLGSQQIDRKMGNAVYVAADANTSQPVPLTQAELNIMTALGLVKS